MSVYKHPSKGHGWWMIKISHGRKGKAEYIPFAGSKGEAQLFERELRGITDQSDPGFLDLLPDFKITYKNRVRETTYASLKYSFAHLCRFFSGFKIRHITPTIIEQYKAKRLSDNVKKRTINIELSALSAYLSWINQTTGAAFALPLKFSRRETRPDMPQVLSLPEMISILSKLKGDIWLIVAIMGLCGLRKNEVLTLTAEQVDLHGKTIMVAGKGGKWRLAPVEIEAILVRLAEKLKEHQKGYIFPSPVKKGQPRADIRKPLTRAAKEAGINKRVNPHLFRHSFATALINDGTDIRIIQELLGHSNLSTTQIYTHIAADSKRDALKSMVAHVANDLNKQNQ